MKSREKVTRREFLKYGGGSLALFSGLAEVGWDAAEAGEAAPRQLRRSQRQVERLLDEMDGRGFQSMSVPRKDGEFLHLMIRATRAKQVLELGTSQGYSAIWMGLALEETGGRLTTVEIDTGRHNEARRNVGRAGLSDRIRLINGDAHTEVPKLEGPFDFVFMDADKEGQVDYFRKLYPAKLQSGCLLAVHNAIRQAYAMKDYLDMIRKHPDFDTVFVSATMDDGFCLSCRHRVP